MGNRSISRDEFTTILAEASSIVNNTPLWTVPNHPDDPSPLTPAMLLTLRTDPNPALMDNYSEEDLLAYGKRRYRRAQYLSEQFWMRWRNEYLQSLTRRHKWKTRKPCITEGDVVLLRDKQLPRNSWPMAKILDAKRSTDGLIRSATIRLAPLPGQKTPRIFKRAIADLVLLIPSQDHACI